MWQWQSTTLRSHALGIWIISAILIGAPNPPETIQEPNRIPPSPCSYINYLMDEAARIAEPGTIIVVISRLGKKERAFWLHNRRLHNVKHYLESEKQRSVVVAFGEKTNGLGVVEIIVNGCRQYVFELGHNADLWTWCSDDGAVNPEYYPWKKDGKHKVIFH